MFKLKIIYFELMLMDISYSWIQRKSARIFTVSPDIGATSSITGDIIFV